jgi:hypothetical protein
MLNLRQQKVNKKYAHLVIEFEFRAQEKELDSSEISDNTLILTTTGPMTLCHKNTCLARKTSI